MVERSKCMNAPEIRFRGFDGEWYSIPLSNPDFTIIAGGDIDKNKIKNVGLYPVIANSTTKDGIVGYYDDCFRIEAPSVSVTGRGDVGIAQARKYNYTPVVRLLSIKSFHDVDFLSNAINKRNLIKESTGVPQLTTIQLSKIEINFPYDKNEECKIGLFIDTIDKVINVNSKKLASLKQIKAASLQSMFPQEGETVPKVRFKGFEGEWKKIQLNKYLDISNNINIHNTYGINDVLSISDEAGVVNQIDFLGRSFAGKSLQKYKILKTNQLVYTKSPLKAKPYGIIKKNFNRTGIVSTLYAIYDCKDNVSSEFIHYYFDPCYRINQYLSPLVNKGAKNTMNISDETALSGEIWIPSLQEQQKIVSYFCNLDKQISLQTQRLEKLKQIKAACLDKMFV